MKAFTDISQSKKLAEFLPLESADMHLKNSSIKGEMYVDEFKPVLLPYLRAKDSLDAYSKIVNNMIAWEVIPCWSLAALLNYLREIDFFPNIEANEHEVTMSICYYDDEEGELLNPVHDIVVKAEGFIDACYELIVKYHEQNIL